MSNLERTTSWQQIQQGLKDAERLIARKEYNLVMVRSRQVLEYMVRCMAERACLVEGDLADTIDQLYEGQWINKATKDNYHTIRILGNKAIHEGDDTAYNANQAYQLLTQEVYVFANEFAGGRSARPAASSKNSSSGRPTARTSSPSAPRGTARQTNKRPPARNARTGAGYQGGGRKKRRRPSPAAYILRLLIPVLIVVLLIVVIRLLMPDPKKNDPKGTTAPVVTTAEPETSPTPAPTAEPETEPQPAFETYRISGNSVNVRSEPSTNGRILTQLARGAEVEYVKRYDNDWSVINYDGQEAYVSSQYIEKVEPAAAEGAQAETEAWEQPEEGA